jgi:phage repressor protein C with HTH and peptisase S24 domain
VRGRKSKENPGVGDGTPPFRSDFASRLRWLLDQFETRVEAGKVAGVTAEHLPSYLKDGAQPRFETIARLAAAQKVSLDWLATGLGPRSLADAEPDGFVAVPVQAEADMRFDADATPPMLFSRAWLKTVTTAPDAALRIVIHRGNANEPVIRDGDAMLVDTSVRGITEDGLYVFPLDGKYQAKFAEKFFNARIALRWGKPDHGAVQTLTLDEAGKLLLLGRVCWRGGVV